jgi:pectate lyase
MIDKKRILIIWIIQILFLKSYIQANERTLAFPGAQGAGAYTKGGRNGKILFITNLEDYHPEKEKPIPGSLRAACETKGSRILIFRVSGTIPLKTSLIISEPYITIAGQSAPGMGICIKNYRFKISADETIVRYLRFRPGDNMENEENFSGDNIDAISMINCKNVIIDHCSASWSVDEVLSVTHSDSVTVQWCIISESLNCSAHHKGCHGYGSLIRGENGAHYSFHHNLYAHHADRSPRPGGHLDPENDPDGFIFDFRNNVIYNWGEKRAGYNTDGASTKYSSVTKINFISNYYITGPDSKGNNFFQDKCKNSRAYFFDNWMNHICPQDQYSLVIFSTKFSEEQKQKYKRIKPFDVSPVITDDAVTAFRKVLANAGAVLPLRDEADTRIINHIINRINTEGDFGKIIDDEDQVGGWPDLKSTPAPGDLDQDGMPDAWEINHHLNSEDPLDYNQDTDGDGYTNIEEFLNNH